MCHVRRLSQHRIDLAPEPQAVSPHGRRRFTVLRTFIWLLLFSSIAYLLSATSMPVRLLYVVTAACGIFTGLHALIRRTRRHRWVRIITAGILVALIAFLALGGRSYETATLRQAYVARLTSFTGALYIWGGESHVGIDCSGLARVALCEAMVSAGIRTGNPRLLGPQLWQFWWQDISAKAMHENYQGLTLTVGHAPQLAGFDAPFLRPGDLAVTDDRSHVMIYLGERRWIEANPEDGRVVINTATDESPRGYFNMPVQIVRWRFMTEPDHR